MRLLRGRGGVLSEFIFRFRFVFFFFSFSVSFFLSTLACLSRGGGTKLMLSIWYIGLSPGISRKIYRRDSRSSRLRGGKLFKRRLRKSHQLVSRVP